MNKVRIFNDLFVDADRYEEEEDDDELTQNGSSNSKFFIAVDRSTNEKIICKVFNSKALQKDTIPNPINKYDQCRYRQHMLLREATILQDLHHPTIVAFKGINLYNSKMQFDENNSKGYTNPTIFLEYLKNKSIQSQITSGKLNIIKMSPVKRQICMLGISAAVRFLHSKRIFHRNICPKTIWLDENFYPKIFDFSTSRNFNLSTDIPKTQIEKSEIRYMAPELLESLNTYTDSIDIFALGRLLYLLYTGYEPFKLVGDPSKNKTDFLLESQIIKDEISPKFPDSNNNEYAALQNLICRCWDHNPNARPTAVEIYYLLSNDDEYHIADFNEIDRQEINDYINLIDKFERENLEENISPPFHFEVPLVVNKIPYSEQVLILLNIIGSNFAASNQLDTLNLLNEMAVNGAIYEEDCLPKVMNFVNYSIRSSNNQIKELANSFIEKIFGKYAFPNEITEISESSISQDVQVINIPPSVKKIKRAAFAGFTRLSRIYIPESVTVIEDEAFCGCINLEYVNIPESIKGSNLGKCVFKGCSKLKYIEIPSITIIKEQTFQGNKSLKNIILNEGIETIGQESFSECESINYIEIPKTVTLIQTKAFYPCKNLSFIYFKALKKPKMEPKAYPSKAKTYP